MKKIVICITRHPINEDRINFLRGIFGQEIAVIEEDVEYGTEPVLAVQKIISNHEEIGEKVVAIEAIAPFPILIKLVEARIGVPLIRTQFKRDDKGRAIIIGKDARDRDILAFSHYEKLVKIVFETQPLEAIAII